MAQTEVQRREAAHRQAHDVRALQFQCIHHRSDVVGRGRLRIALHILRHVRRPIAARAESHALVAAREVTHLWLPTAVVTAELVHEHDRRALAGALVVEANAVAGTGVAHRRPLLRNAQNNAAVAGRLRARPTACGSTWHSACAHAFGTVVEIFTKRWPKRGVWYVPCRTMMPCSPSAATSASGVTPEALHSTTMKFACDGNTGTAKPGNLAKAPAIIRWFSRCCAITRAIHSPFTAKPAMAAPCASTLAPTAPSHCREARAPPSPAGPRRRRRVGQEPPRQPGRSPERPEAQAREPEPFG